jgi:hypothetical protein
MRKSGSSRNPMGGHTPTPTNTTDPIRRGSSRSATRGVVTVPEMVCGVHDILQKISQHIVTPIFREDVTVERLQDLFM